MGGSSIAEIDEIIEKYTEPGSLIRILQKVQDIYGYLSEDVQTYIAGRLHIPVSEINGVVTFYSLFSTKPKGKYKISVCMGTACYVKGANKILDRLKEELGADEGETSSDGLFTLLATRCVGACGLAPVITIGDNVHGRLSPDDIPLLIQKYRSKEITGSSRMKTGALQ